MSATVFVRNLPFDVTQDALEQVFGEIGPVKKVDVIKDKGKRKSEATTRGFAFVRYAMAADAQLALEKLHQHEFNGRRMVLDLAQEKSKRRKVEPNPRSYEAQTAYESEATAVTAVPDEAPQTTTEDVDDEAEKKKKKKEKKAAKKAKKEAQAEAEAQAEEEAAAEADVEAEAAKKKAKKKAAKKEKKAKQTEGEVKVEDETMPLAEEEATSAAKKKEAKAAKQETAPIRFAEPPTPVADATGHVQSERNARRRMHREFLRQVELRKQSAATEEEKTILVYGLGAGVTQKALYKKVKKLGAVAKVELKEEPKTLKKFAVVLMQQLPDVAKAVQKLDSHIFKGATLRALRMSDAKQQEKQQEVAGGGLRLIVRNLSFETTDADLEMLFGECGALAEVRVVRLAPEDSESAALGKSRGFGFVQYHAMADARAAIDKLNGFKLRGREMIVDFALSKSKYLEQQKQAAEEKGEAADEDEGEEEEKEEEDDDDDEEDDDGVDHATFDHSDDEGDVESDEDDEEEEETAAKRVPKEDSEDQRARTIFLRNLSFQSTEDGLKEFFGGFGRVEYARVVYDKGSGLSKGVAFVRFAERAVADRVIARSQAVAAQHEVDRHSKYKNKKKAKDENAFTLSALADGDALLLDGRMLSVTRSVAKDDAERLAEANSMERKKKDKRNMYLAYEGTISVNKLSEEELGLPKTDVEKRRRAIREKKEKLKNPMYFVSPVRLSVRNLSTSVDDKQLKQLFQEAAATGLKHRKVDLKELKLEFVPEGKVPVKVKMAKVVRDMDNVKPGKEPRSRGYAFVEFSEHMHALAALRQLNNDPQYTKFAVGGGKRATTSASALPDSDKSRLIVEFALENHGKLKLREKKHDDAQKKREEERALRNAQGDGEDAEGGKKASRGQRQRANKKARAAEGGEGGDGETQGQAQTGKPVPKVKKVKPTVVKADKSKKRKRPEGEDELEGVGRLPSRSRLAANEPKPLSRKQRKEADEMAREKSFEAMVHSYKKEIFGEKPVRKEDSSHDSGSGLGSLVTAAAASRWFD